MGRNCAGSVLRAVQRLTNVVSQLFRPLVPLGRRKGLKEPDPGHSERWRLVFEISTVYSVYKTVPTVDRIVNKKILGGRFF
jgi:hypothetical protein